MAADGSVLIEFNANASPAEKELAKLKRKIKEAEEAAYQDAAKKDSLQEQTAQAAANLDEAKRILYEMRNASRGTFSAEEISDQRERVRGLQTEYNQMANSAKRLDERMSASNEQIASMRNRASDLQAHIEATASSSSRMGDAISRAGEHLDRFATRVKRLAQRVFVFTLITTALRGIRTWMGNVLKTNKEAQASIAKLKAALLTLVQPLVNVLIPAFVTLTNLLTRLATIAARVVSLLFGTTLQQSAESAKALNEQREAIEGVGAAAKEAEGSLASFDEINTISSEKNAGGGGEGINATGTPPDFDSIINSPLDTILEFFTGAALLALGAILTFSGANIPLGIGLMAIGAAFLYDAIKTNWGAIAQALQGPIGVVMAIISGALFAIGAVLLFSGANIPLGLALIAIGALGMAAPLVANWQTIQTALQGPIGAITALLSTAFLVIGAVLAFSGVNVAVGIGLMAVGAVGLATTIAANWETIQTALEGPVGAIVSLMSGALIVIGAVLLFSGGSIPLGIGLMAAGAVGLATAQSPNWETIQNALRGPIGEITALISGALLVLGAVLLFTGANIPLGLGMLVAGGATLAANLKANWSTVINALRGPLGTVTALVSGSLLALGAILLFTGAGIPLGLGLILAGASGLAAAVAPNWSALVQKMKKIINDIKTYVINPVVNAFTGLYNKVVGIVEGMVNGFIGIINAFIRGINRVIGTINKIPGVSIGTLSTLSTVSIPRLAQGAVIPPNREFMAVLGDQRSGNNIEAPEDLIRKIVREETGGNAEMVALLRQILSATKARQKLYVKERVLAETARDGINDMTRQAGKPVILF